jgi:hypothetical protein
MKVGDLVKHRGTRRGRGGRGNVGIITSVLEAHLNNYPLDQFLVYWFNAKWDGLRTRETGQTLRWVGKKIEKNSQVSGFSTLTFVDAQTIITV